VVDAVGETATEREQQLPIFLRRSASIGRRQPSSCHHPVLEVRDARRLDRPDLLKLDLGAPEIVEEASAVPEQHRNDVEFEFVQEPRRQIPLNDLSAAPEPDASPR
jgi:hypothetical protein